MTIDPIEWATACTPVDFMAHVFEVFSTMSYADGERIMQIIIDRANHGDKALENVFRLFADSSILQRGIARGGNDLTREVIAVMLAAYTAMPEALRVDIEQAQWWMDDYVTHFHPDLVARMKLENAEHTKRIERAYKEGRVRYFPPKE